ncbi:hypothetical protein L0222_06960 [bacterium]|nr:hypothetical protein [bacterium]
MRTSIRLVLVLCLVLPLAIAAQSKFSGANGCLDLRIGKILQGQYCSKPSGPIVWGNLNKGVFEPTNSVDFADLAVDPDPKFTPGWIELRTGQTHFDYEGRGPQSPYLRGRIDPKGGFHVYPEELKQWTKSSSYNMSGAEGYRKPEPDSSASTKGGATQALIRSLEGQSIEVRFTPKEITIDNAVFWDKTNNHGVLAFRAEEPKTLQVELYFESNSGVYNSYIRQLETLTRTDDDLRRPPRCQFAWGSNFPAFNGVVANVSTKYTQFLSDGTPVRATVQLRMIEAILLLNATERNQMTR